MGIFPSLQTLHKTTKDHLELTEAQRLMYTAEKQQNFRWVSKLFSGYSNYRLKEEDIVSEDLVFWLREIGEHRRDFDAVYHADIFQGNSRRWSMPPFP
jgi:hypothetical protein